MTSLVVVSAGLTVPSSTRLLADRLAAATVEALGDVEVDPCRAARPRAPAHRPPAHRLPRPASSRRPKQRSAAADGLIVVTPVFSASYSGLFKTFFDVLEDGAPGRQAGAGRRHRRHRPALAGARARAAPAVRLPARGRRAHRRLRRHRGLRRHRPRRPHHPRRGRAGRAHGQVGDTAARSRSAAPSRTSSPTATPFEQLLRQASVA